MEQRDPSQRICDPNFVRSYHDSLSYRLEKVGCDNHVGFAEVHRKDFAGRWRSNALEGSVEAGNSLGGMEVNIHSHLRKVSSRREVM